MGDAGKAALESDGEANRVSTREWARNSGYDSRKLFQKFFNDDIKYLLSMANLWVTRRAPTPLELDELPDQGRSLIPPTFPTTLPKMTFGD